MPSASKSYLLFVCPFSAFAKLLWPAGRLPAKMCTNQIFQQAICPPYPRPCFSVCPAGSHKCSSRDGEETQQATTKNKCDAKHGNANRQQLREPLLQRVLCPTTRMMLLTHTAPIYWWDRHCSEVSGLTRARYSLTELGAEDRRKTPGKVFKHRVHHCAQT